MDGGGNRQAKAALREEALRRRGGLSPEARIEGSLAVADRIAELSFEPGAVVSGFWPIRDEIDPRPAMHNLRQHGHRLCLPAIVEGKLVFRRLDPETRLVKAGFGTVEPGPEADVLSPAVMLVPLAAFDRVGHRLGYGKGYYDQAIGALRSTAKPLCIGVAFSVQEVPAVPFEDHDQPLSLIVTEREIIHCREFV
ncbi:5-formyltetrahydrofolate cyclo-ligase [Stappia sp. F7233]|uniref:5-formyltetrahydrofolate cyclo-ligase n=1 Tax=Stappia albiluteola TaxID=2758565 RepID=A0A839ACA6_9HYPH|nr:5-formyltetrahydrofolate cyclo-ligase [Stappia albiluteola]